MYTIPDMNHKKAGKRKNCMVMDLDLGKTDVYLLNPDSRFCNSKQIKGSIALVYIKFSEKDKAFGIKYLESFGQVTKLDLD